MIGHTLVYLSAVLVFLTCLLATSIVYLRRARRIVRVDDVGALLARLVVVERHKLEQVAFDLPGTMSEQGEAAMDSWQVWDLAGGLPGIEALAANCEVLIDLASYVQKWYPEALPITEELRLNAREIQWHLGRLRGAEQHGHGRSAYPEYAQQAVAIYCRMTRHVLNLYEAAGMTALPELQAVL